MPEACSLPADAAGAARARHAAWPVLAAVSWVLLCLAWFDAAAPFRPAVVEAVPPGVAAALLAFALAAWAWTAARSPGPPPLAGWREPGLLLVVALAVLFRLPMAWQGSAGYVTADGALSGLMALDVRDGRAHDVFVPHVAYSGSLKAHLTAPLAAVMDPSRAFALVSVLFYGAFVAAVHRLARQAGGERAAVAAGLYAAFAPAFVTRYSLSNDGNYVEVLALGTWALVVALGAAAREGSSRAFGIGLLLGLAFWCHILAVIPAAAVALFLLRESPRRWARALPWASLGFVAGDLPGLLWNAAHGWDSFSHLRPGAGGAAGAPALLARAVALVTDHLPVLLGYDFGYPRPVDVALSLVAGAAIVLLAWGTGRALRRARGEEGRAWRAVLALVLVNVAVALAALPYIPGNPRYLLFLMGAVPVLVAPAVAHPAGRVVLAVVIGTGALASLAQAVGAAASDRQWRTFVRGLEEEGVRWCYTDFHLATKVNFLSGQRIECSSKLGPTTTEYFFRFREAVEAAPEAAFIAVNATNVEKLERRLERLGVTYARRDLMKPVLLRLSRKVDPEEIFPDRAFPLR
ncbi:MAG TPA: glycosyltransferase family 39 protein [Vicinamibacteria bacterium]|nr:glycosyltransferase family 39 protein [Vicinamibacteria bacterium]